MGVKVAYYEVQCGSSSPGEVRVSVESQAQFCAKHGPLAVHGCPECESKHAKQEPMRISNMAWDSYRNRRDWAERPRLEFWLAEFNCVMLHEDEYRTLSELASGSRLRSADNQAMAALDAENARLREELREARGNYENACKTIAQMHEAAMGQMCGPKRGVVEDVADLRLEYERLRNGKPPKRADGVIHVEPFPEVKPRTDVGPAPSHRPRYIPFL